MFPGQKGEIRTVRVQTKHGMTNRTTIKFSTEGEPHRTLLTFKRWKNPENAEETKRPHNSQRLMTLRHWWGNMKKPTNTGHAKGVQSDIPSDEWVWVRVFFVLRVCLKSRITSLDVILPD